MPPILATVMCVGVVATLFALNRDRKARTSKALWLATVWLLLAGSRNISEWLSPGGSMQVGQQYLEGNPLDRNVLAALMLVGLIVLIGRRRRVVRLLQSNLPILLFLTYCGISIAWSDFSGVAFRRWIKAWADVVAVLIILTDPDPHAAIKRVLSRVGFLLIPFSILFIRYYPDWGRAYSRWEGTMFYTGVTTNKNTLGMVCLVVGVGAVWQLLLAFQEHSNQSHRKGRVIAQATLLIMVLTLLYQVNSATALACLVLASGLLLATDLQIVVRRRWAVHTLVVGVVSIAFSALFLNIGSVMVESLGRNSTLTGRTFLWADILQMVVDPLFGAGYESFWIGPRLEQIFLLSGMIPNEAHNGYLEIYINLGAIGVAMLSLIIASGYRRIMRSFLFEPGVARLQLAFFVSALAYNFTEAAFKMTHPIWILFLWSTMAIPMAAATVRVRAPQSAPVPLLAGFGSHEWVKPAR